MDPYMYFEGGILNASEVAIATNPFYVLSTHHSAPLQLYEPMPAVESYSKTSTNATTRAHSYTKCTKCFSKEKCTCTATKPIKKKPALIRSWTPNEDHLLRTLVTEHGPKWAEIAYILKNEFNIHRLGKQCRERWCNHVNPNIKHGEWTPEEDQVILKYQSNIGNRWAQIAKALDGRTENSVKNRFVSLLSRGWKRNGDNKANGKSQSDSNESASEKMTESLEEDKKVAVGKGLSPKAVGKYSHGVQQDASVASNSKDSTNALESVGTVKTEPCFPYVLCGGTQANYMPAPESSSYHRQYSSLRQSTSDKTFSDIDSIFHDTGSFNIWSNGFQETPMNSYDAPLTCSFEMDSLLEQRGEDYKLCDSWKDPTYDLNTIVFNGVGVTGQMGALNKLNFFT